MSYVLETILTILGSFVLWYLVLTLLGAATVWILAIVRFIIFGGALVLLVRPLIEKIPNGVVRVLVMFIVAFISWALIMTLCRTFRLVGYSVNFFMGSIMWLIFAELLKNKIEVNFVTHLFGLLVLPRMMWMIDRIKTYDRVTDTKWEWYSDLKGDTMLCSSINSYEEVESDAWGNFEGVGRFLPIQIVLALPFYFLGSSTILADHPIETNALMWLYLILAALINLLFDLFVFTKIEESVN